ncbi:MAG: alpha/beta hydrolase [Pirellulales bacterium]
MKTARIASRLWPITSLVIVASWIACLSPAAVAQQKNDYPPHFEGAVEHVYCKRGDTPLKLYAFNPPPNFKTPRPAIVFFFGGGWASGNPRQFEQHCRYLASRGMVAITADYRVSTRHATKAIDAVQDAIDAFTFVRQHAKEWNIDPNRIAASGGSAGGHLAACLSTVSAPLPLSTRKESHPNALILYNPAAALAAYPGMQAATQKRTLGLAERMGIDPEELSPAHHVTKDMPPTIQFFGTDDDLLGGAKFMHDQMKERGVRSELLTYEGQVHGFFNYGRNSNKYFLETLDATDTFLQSLGWLEGPSQVRSHFSK